MKIINGLKIGGLQQKIFNLMLIFIIVLVGAYLAVGMYQQRELTKLVQESGQRQQESIAEVSESTMKSVLESSMVQSTALQAYIADDMFSDVKADVLTLQEFATELFEHAENFTDHPVYEPVAANDGVPSVQLQHEAAVNPADSKTLGLLANMSEIMLAMFENSDKLSSCLAATADGNIIFVDDRAGSYFSEDGEIYTFEVRERPWYKQAVEAGELIFTGVELDAFTDIPGLVCAAPVYKDGKLVAVVGADVFLTSISDYVNSSAENGSFICVVDENGQVVFSPESDGTFKAELSGNAQDLRESGNTELADFISKALSESTGLCEITIDGKEYYLAGAPMESVGWAAVSVVDKEVTHQPTALMIGQYESINDDALATYTAGTRNSARMLVILTAVIFLLATIGALAVATRITKPLTHMAKRIDALSGSDGAFEMEKVYETDDEIQILAESFTAISAKTREYIRQITDITAEKERIGAELSLASRIQGDMLPNIYPAFPRRPEFDIYASMTPAKEVGGDFYDFFLIDDDHLGLVMADVSGKGVPAALFMMISKILIQNYAMLGGSPAEVLKNANTQICRNNKEEMFVTVWFGILEISSGKIIAANAGHEYPVMRKADGAFEMIKDKHGFVLGGMEGMTYKEYELQLEKGGVLFLYTDGVPEATDAEGELFGNERLLAALNKDPQADVVTILENMKNSVDEFVGEAPQFDDLTMLAVKLV